MHTVLINYADRGFAQSQKLNTETGLVIGGLQRAIPYNRADLDPEFSERHKDVLARERGAGYWIWKPYITLRTLKQEMDEGDVLFYSDSGCFFMASVAPLIDHCVKRTDKPILLFGGDPAFSNRRYTKRDCLHYMGADREPFLSLPQSISTFFIMRKTPFTIGFVEEWQRLAEDPRLLTDDANVCGLPNHADFVNHRHDQSILSLLGVKHGISVIADVSQWGNHFRVPHIPQIMAQTRSRA
jgi:hypothetical protein